MGEPYTVTALIVITLGGFGSMGGALAGGLALGVIEAVGMHFTSPSLKSAAELRHLHRRAALETQRPFQQEMTTPPKRPAAASPQGAPPAARQSRFRGGCLHGSAEVPRP